MQLIAYGKRGRSVPRVSIKTFLVMKMLAILLFVACMGASAKGKGQTITLSLKNASLETAFRQIEQQTIYRFVYTKEQLQNTSPLTLEMKSGDLTLILQAVFKTQPLTFTIESKYVLIKPLEKTETRANALLVDIRGRLLNEQNDPVIGATVSVKGTSRITTSSAEGNFSFAQLSLPATLIVTGAEIEKQEISVTSAEFLLVKLKAKVGELDEVIMMAYGQTTRRLNTGNISKVTSEEISRQPVSNVLTALQGRVPGLLINQTNGYGSGTVDIQLRGQNSLLQNSQPFFVIDGVPLSTQNSPINQLSNASGSGTSPFYTINPADIESIEILKDADATAIYGSRGANGVILITTKKGKAGKTAVNGNVYYGASRVTRTMDLLNTQQYVQMRKEAYANDNIIPTGNNALDIMVWDTTRYTDLKKLFLGGTAKTFNANVGMSGGNASTQFLVSFGYQRQTTVLPVHNADYLASVHTSLNHTSTNKRFGLQLTSTYAYRSNNLPGIDPSVLIARPPNQLLYDSSGKLAWQEGGVSFRSTGFSQFSNPLAVLYTTYDGDYQNLNSNLLLHYKILPTLTFKTSFGYNTILGDEIQTNPSASLDPFATGQVLSAFFSTSASRNWIIEPELTWISTTKYGKLSVLLGGTFQRNTGTSTNVSASNFSSDLLLNSISGAGTVSTTNSYREFRYNAFFTRINYNYKDRYILNLTARRDGSSRFGPSSQFANFGAMGWAWIFSNEKLIAKRLPWISFGKFRGSYGTTGNDGIADYKFLDTWTTSNTSYQGVAPLLPLSLFNPELAWEVNKKFEVALDIGLLKQRILFSASYFSNRSGNQLVAYNLPIQTGFTSITRNLPALIANNGIELTLSTNNITGKSFSWSTQLNVTRARNKLLAFPGLELSSYATTYVIGEPLAVRRLYHSLGVDPVTGTYNFLDVDQSGTIGTRDRTVYKTINPEFYGGISNQFLYHGLALDIFVQFVKQEGVNYIGSISGLSPGSRYQNHPVIVLNRWQHVGDLSDIQKFTTQTGTASINNLGVSNALFSDASFIRCKNVSLSYQLPERWLKKMKSTMKIYMHAQNLFTITGYVGADPENQNMFRMPPLRTITGGVQFTF